MADSAWLYGCECGRQTVMYIVAASYRCSCGKVVKPTSITRTQALAIERKMKPKGSGSHRK